MKYTAIWMIEDAQARVARALKLAQIARMKAEQGIPHRELRESTLKDLDEIIEMLNRQKAELGKRRRK